MFDSLPQNVDALIIGAGPSGTAMASMLADQGIQALIIERDQFPRFAIGESLLPEAINCLEAAGLLDAVEAGGYQHKDGALFATNEETRTIDFADGFTAGRSYAYQVPRADFDLRLAQACIGKGVAVSWQTSVVDIAPVDKGYRLRLERQGEQRQINCGFLIDASGFGRVLARKFGLDRPDGFAGKRALFSHIDSDAGDHFDRNKILIAQTRPESPNWYWVIPFARGSCSVGVVVDADAPVSPLGHEQDFCGFLEEQTLVAKTSQGKGLLREVGCISGYSSAISSLHGDRYVILGNAGEFIDPIFSSGVTIALKSAQLAAPLVAASIKNESTADWQGLFERPLREGIDTFKEYVRAWYDGTVPQLIFQQRRDAGIYSMICGILSGYVWDRSNPMTRMTASRLQSLIMPD